MLIILSEASCFISVPWAASSLGDMYRNCMVFLGNCVVFFFFLIWETCESLLKWEDLTVCAAVRPSGGRCLWKLPPTTLPACLNLPLQPLGYSRFLHCSRVITMCFLVVGKPLKVGRVCQFKGTLKAWVSIHSLSNLFPSPSLYLLSLHAECYLRSPHVPSWISACLPTHLNFPLLVPPLHLANS